jgi:hypothetical protein
VNHKHFNIIPNVQGQLNLEGNGSFFEFLGQHVTIWISSIEQLTSTIDKEYKRAVKIHAELSDTVKRTLPGDLYMHPTEVQEVLADHSTIEWGPE